MVDNDCLGTLLRELCVQNRRHPMSCKLCGRENGRAFNGEVAIHFPGRDGLNKAIVWVFPKLSVCLRCGFRGVHGSRKRNECVDEWQSRRRIGDLSRVSTALAALISAIRENFGGERCGHGRSHSVVY
jgi:hypothetical protein